MKIIISLLIAGGIVVAIFFYGLFGGSTTSKQISNGDDVSTTEENQSDEAEPQEFRGETTLERIKDLGTSLECRISYQAPDQIDPIVGTYFVNGESIRGDFEMNSPELDGPVVSSIIFDDGWFYSWSLIEGQAYGIKMDTSAMAEVDNQSVRQPVPDDEMVSYECFEWRSVDRSIFVPPSNILFQDMADRFESGMEYGTVYEEGEF